jgi:hypothetical protein
LARRRFRLGETDRERLGGPEWVEFDNTVLTLRELCAVFDAFGIKPGEWPQVEASGNPIGWIVVVWAARRRAGVVEDLATFDFNAQSLEVIDDSPEPAETDAGNSQAGPEPAPTKRVRKAAPRKSATRRATRAS